MSTLSIIKRNRIFPLVLIALFFILIRMWGLSLPPHQDEVKWFQHAIADDEGIRGGMGHPPLSALTFRVAAKIFGADYFRMMTLSLSLINLVLIYFFLLKNFSRAAAIWGALIFSVSFYGILGSLMIDTDGAVLPLFFVITLTAYFNLIKTAESKNKIRWGLLLVLGLAGGMLTKLSFVLVAGALGADVIYEYRRSIKLKYLFWSAGVALALAGITILIMSKSELVLGNYNLARVISHAGDFFKFSDRNYFQTFFQVAKAIMYGSPILFLPVFFMSSVNLKKIRVLLIYVALNLIFYTLLFDFSSGAIDKYLLALVVPFAIMGGVVVSGTLSVANRRFWIWPLIGGFLLMLIVAGLQLLPHAVPPLYPKNEWISRVFDLRWNFLIPFTGGSGPMGFYVSWLFIAVNWLVSLALIMLGLGFEKIRPQILIVILVLGLGYNIVFAEEYLFGKINGNSSALIRDAVEFIDRNPKIGRLMTYNDIGGSYLMDRGRYERRIFVAPKYESSYRDILNNFKKYYLVVDIPRISDVSIFAKYFSSCAIIYEKYSVKILTIIYDCKNAVNL